MIPSSLNGKTKKLTRKAPSSSFSIFLLPSQHESSKGLLSHLSLPHPQVQWDFHGPFPLGPLGQGRHVLHSAYSSPSALEPRSGPPLERRPSLSFGPPPPLVSLLPALSLTSTPIHPFSDMIWLLGTLVSNEAQSSVQVGTDLGHFLLCPELPDLPGTRDGCAEQRMWKRAIVFATPCRARNCV